MRYLFDKATMWLFWGLFILVGLPIYWVSLGFLHVLLYIVQELLRLHAKINN